MQFSSLANQELHWYGTDTEQLYQQNLTTNSDKLTKFGWVNQSIIYKFNSHGFRADEFDSTDKNVMFLGCSHTLGVGLPAESTWAHIVSTSLKFKNYNLGLGGVSNDTAFRLCHKWIDQLCPDIVIFLSTERTRFELHTVDNQIEDHSVHAQFDNNKNFTQNWFGNDINGDMNYLKNTLAVKQLCDTRGIKYVHEEALNIHQLDQARDLQHFGTNTHRRIAAMFLSRL
jgi:hypothetical protein